MVRKGRQERGEGGRRVGKRLGGKDGLDREVENARK
jgi:hypothetical protein